MNTNMSKGYTFLIDALSDYDLFVRYFDTGEWNTYFMHLLLEKIGAWSPVVQARIFDSAAQKMKMLDMA